VGVAGALLALWLALDPRTADLAAQVYRLGLYERAGLSVFDEHWYAGHALPGYSLLFGPLAALIGMRALAVVSVLVSVTLFERIVLDAYGDEACVRWGACLFAVAAVGDVWAGRLTFALGVTLAMVCVYALSRERLLLAVPAAGLCAAASPVAGVLLALAGLSYALARHDLRVLLAVGAPVAMVVLAVRALFPEGGYEPYPTTSFAATAIVVCVFLWALPRGERNRVLRVGAVVYLLACLVCVVVRTPMGSNVERYGVLLAGPLLLCGLAGEGSRVRANRPGRRRRSMGRAPAHARAWAVGVGVCVAMVWTVWGPVRETRAVAGSPATSAAYYAPLERYLLAHGAGMERVEVPLTRSHWEAAMLAPRVSLARGWEKQLEERYDSPLLGSGLTAAGYRAWLSNEGVAYVVLPDVPLDPSSAREGALIRGGLPYLQQVWANAHWRVFQVVGATPLLQGAGRVVALGSDTFAVYANAPGSLLMRVHYTGYDTVLSGHGCVASAPGGWTEVRARAQGEIVVGARFSLGRALGLDGACH
jgi:hypothetical protein